MIFEAISISKKYGNKSILDSISFSISKGSICGLVGPNGAGKTTLFKIIAGLATPTSGDFSVFCNMNDDTSLSLKRKKIGFIIENPALIPSFSVRANMIFFSKLYGIKDSFKKVDDLLHLVGLYEEKSKKVRHLSLGMKQRLAIALAMINDPLFLVLDEPINGLDPLGITQLRELLLHINKVNGVTILLSSHILSELANLATEVIFLNSGRIISQRKITDFDDYSSLESTYVDLFSNSGAKDI